MVQAHFSWRACTKKFCPAVTCSSYVDNLGARGGFPHDFIEALLTTKNFYALWNLCLDDRKTLCGAQQKHFVKAFSCFPGMEHQFVGSFKRFEPKPKRHCESITLVAMLCSFYLCVAPWKPTQASTN